MSEGKVGVGFTIYWFYQKIFFLQITEVICCWRLFNSLIKWYVSAPLKKISYSLIDFWISVEFIDGEPSESGV